jgi:hypothetical protein
LVFVCNKSAMGGGVWLKDAGRGPQKRLPKSPELPKLPIETGESPGEEIGKWVIEEQITRSRPGKCGIGARMNEVGDQKSKSNEDFMANNPAASWGTGVFPASALSNVGAVDFEEEREAVGV